MPTTEGEERPILEEVGVARTRWALPISAVSSMSEAIEPVVWEENDPSEEDAPIWEADCG
jgi:hypothetical protein